MNIPIDVKDRRVLKFNNLQHDIALNAAVNGGINLQHDLELTGKNKWLVHIDVWFAEPGKASIICRTSFALTTRFENIWAEGVASEYVKFALAVSRTAFNDECIKCKIDCALDERFTSDEIVTACLRELLKDVQLNGLYSNEGKELYNWQTLKLPPTGDVCLVASGTVVVLDEILLDNPAFNRIRNIETFNNFIPLRFYSTIKLKVLKLAEGKPIFLNLKQFTFYVLMVRCACTLLLTEHYDNMKELLYKKGLREKEYDLYIKAASTFLNNVKTDLEAKRVSIINWEEDIDWEALVY